MVIHVVLLGRAYNMLHMWNLIAVLIEFNHPKIMVGFAQVCTYKLVCYIVCVHMCIVC